jgi:hypothetical protein
MSCWVSVGATALSVWMSPRRPSAMEVIFGAFVGGIVAFVAFVLNIHGCGEGAPTTQWLVPSVAVVLTVAGVRHNALRWGLVVGQLALAFLLSRLFVEAVHLPTWTARPDLGEVAWHSPVTGLRVRIPPSLDELKRQLVTRMLTLKTAVESCTRADRLALAIRALGVDAPAGVVSELDELTAIPNEPCLQAARVALGTTSPLLFPEAPVAEGPSVQEARTALDLLLAEMSEAGASQWDREIAPNYLFAALMVDVGPGLSTEDALSLLAHVPADSAVWDRSMAVASLAGSLSEPVGTALAPEISKTLLAPDATPFDRLALATVFPAWLREDDLAAVARSSEVATARRVSLIAGSRAQAGQLGRFWDAALLSLIDAEADPYVRAALAADALRALGPL